MMGCEYIFTPSMINMSRPEVEKIYFLARGTDEVTV